MTRQRETRGCKALARKGKAAVVSALLTCTICLVSFGTISAQKASVDIEGARATLEKWVETQRIIGQEKRDLALSKETLNERIELVQREIESLRGKIGQAEESIAEADKKRAEMVEENEKLKQASASLSEILVLMETRTKQLLQRLPDPISERVKPLSQRLPEDTEQTKLTVSDRFANVVGILNEVDKFNREISVTSEVRGLPGGKSIEVAALYAGISKGYYVGGNGTMAGIGTATDKWVWQHNNEAAPQIADAIAILKNEKIASFIQLPVEIE